MNQHQNNHEKLLILNNNKIVACVKVGRLNNKISINKSFIEFFYLFHYHFKALTNFPLSVFFLFLKDTQLISIILCYLIIYVRLS